MTLNWKDLSKWQKDNEYIRSGYRKPSYSTYRSIREIKKLHNETVNIWSHLLAAILFFIYLIHFLGKSDGLFMDILVVIISFLGIIVCFTFSTIYHLFSNHSRRVANWTQRLDHLGVVIVIWTSAISFTYFGLYCHRQLRGLYMSLITVTGLISTIYVFQPGFRDPNSRLIRTFTYFTLGYSAFLPAIHLLIQADELALYQHTILASYKSLVILNSIGGFFYVIRIPERFHRKLGQHLSGKTPPGVFDIYCASHQIMHVMVVCGALVYQTGLLTTREYWRSDKIRGTACLTAF